MFWRLPVWLLRTHIIFKQGTPDDRFDGSGNCRKKNGEIVPFRLLEKKCSLFLLIQENKMAKQSQRLNGLRAMRIEAAKARYLPDQCHTI